MSRTRGCSRPSCGVGWPCLQPPATASVRDFVLHSSDRVMTATRQIRRGVWVGLTLVLAACEGRASRAPNPTAYQWPDAIAYRVDYVSDAQSGRQTIVHYAESKTTRLTIRDAQYFGEQDSVLKTIQRPGEAPQQQPYAP